MKVLCLLALCFLAVAASDIAPAENLENSPVNPFAVSPNTKCNNVISDPTDPSKNNIEIHYLQTQPTDNAHINDRAPDLQITPGQTNWNNVNYDESHEAWVKNGRFPFGEYIFCTTVQSYYPPPFGQSNTVVEDGKTVLAVPSKLGTKWARGTDLYVRFMFTLSADLQTVDFIPILQVVKDNDLLHLSYNGVELVGPSNSADFARGQCGALVGQGVSALFQFPLNPSNLVFGGGKNIIAIKVRDRDLGAGANGRDDQSFLGVFTPFSVNVEDGTDGSITTPGSCVCIGQTVSPPLNKPCPNGVETCCANGALAEAGCTVVV